MAGLLAVGLRLALLPVTPIPVPWIHDEFSYLLGADTFASGRVTNPPHPMWVHFETMHVNPQPTYCSKYPPGQALFLALGQKMFGHPWFGVCLSVGFLFVSICWMLQGWVSPGYALLATVLGILGWGLSGQMINSYWGGAVAAAGGALVIGAIPRIVSRPKTTTILVGSIGLILLANSRPFEGLLTACGAAGALVWRARCSNRPIRSLVTRRTCIAFFSVMVPAAAAMGYYNYRTTGNALVLPYAVNQQMYAAPPLIYLFPMPPAQEYRHENIRRYWTELIRPAYDRARNNPLRTIKLSLLALCEFYVICPFVLLIVAGLLLSWGRDVGTALLIIAPPLAGLMTVEVVWPHYLAPAFGALLLIGAIGLQQIGRRGSPGRILVAGMIGISVGWCAIGIRIDAEHARQAPAGITTRPLLIDRLERQGGRHLVIVHYRPDHDVHAEWVYNRADIDGSDVVWAQDMGAERNRELLDYYRGRKVWLLQPDVDPLALIPYPGPPTS